MTYDAVLFDNDGVLIEGTAGEVMRQGVANAFAAAGVEDPDPELVAELANFSELTVDRVCDIARDHGLVPEEFWRLREDEVSAAQREAMRAGEKSLFEDFDALAELEELDADLGIVSNNQHDTVGHMIDQFGLEGRFATIYGVEPSFDGLRRKKPDPYYLDRAIGDLGGKMVYVGDKATDVRAARWAGLDAVYLRRDDDHPPGEEFEIQPEFEITSLRELPPIVARETHAATTD